MGRAIDIPDDWPETLKRLRQEYKEWKERQPGRATYEELAKELSRVRGGDPIKPTTLSKHMSGTAKLSRSYMESYAKVFLCRVEYLLDEDDFRTEEDILRLAGVAGGERIERIDEHMRLLTLLGYSLRPRLFLHSFAYQLPSGKWLDALCDHWDEIKPTLTKTALTLPIEKDSAVTFANWNGKTHLTADYSTGIPVRRTIDGSYTADYSNDDPSYIYAGELKYSLEYEVYKDGNRMAWLTMKDLESVFSHFDRYATLTLDIAFEGHCTPKELRGRIDERDSIYDYQ